MSSRKVCVNCKYYPLCEYCESPGGYCYRFEWKGQLPHDKSGN